MKVHYLEFVTPDVDSVCETLEIGQSVSFGDPDPALGGARTAAMAGGGMVGVRAPLREDEAPVVRSYFLVENIQSTVDASAEAGALVALPPMPLGDHGTCAIVIQGGVEVGFWQV